MRGSPLREIVMRRNGDAKFLLSRACPANDLMLVVGPTRDYARAIRCMCVCVCVRRALDDTNTRYVARSADSLSRYMYTQRSLIRKRVLVRIA